VARKGNNNEVSNEVDEDEDDRVTERVNFNLYKI